MSEKANRILPDNLEYKLNFLKLTRNGKINLSVFPKKALYKALDLLQRTHIETPNDPYNVYYALCMAEAKRLGVEPKWDVLKSFPLYNNESAMTIEGEMFDMKKCSYFMMNATKVRPKRGAFSSQYTTSGRSQGGPTFNRGLTYWKYGKEYKYPDQAIDNDTNPTKEDPTYVPPLPQDDPSRYDIDQVEQIKKAIRSGNINKEALRYLQGAFADKPALLKVIDVYLQMDINNKEPTYDQTDLPF